MSDLSLIPKPYNWHRAMMEMAVTISKMSKDPRTQVGAVICSPDHTQIAVGWNGFPRHFPDHRYVWENRSDDSQLTKYDVVIHAEENAVLNCHVRPLGWTLYCTHHPCVRCAARLAQAGIDRIYYRAVPDAPNNHCDRAAYVFRQSGGVITSTEEVT